MAFQDMVPANTFMVYLQYKYFVTCFALFIYNILFVDFLLHNCKNSQFRPPYSYHVTQYSILRKHHLKYSLKTIETLWISVFSSLYCKIKKTPNYEYIVTLMSQKYSSFYFLSLPLFYPSSFISVSFLYFNTHFEVSSEMALQSTEDLLLLKVDSHITCRVHAAPMPFPCHAVPLRA